MALEDSLFAPLPNATAPRANDPASSPPPADQDAQRRALLMRAFAPQANVAQRLAAGVASIPTAPLGVYNLASEGTRYVTGSPLPGGDTAGRWAQEYNQGVHNLLGINEPDNIVDRGLEIGGSMAVGPLGAQAGVPSLVRGALSGVAGLPSTLRGVVGWTAGLTGASAVMDAAQAQAAPASPPQAQVAAAPTPAPATGHPDSLFTQPQAAPATPALSPAAPGSQVQPPATSNPDSLFSVPPPPPPPPAGSIMDWALPAAMAAGAALVLHRAVRPTPAAGVTRAPLTGTNPAAASATPWLVAQQANLLDSTAPVTHALREQGPTIHAVGTNIFTNDFNPSALGVRRMHAWTEGSMDGTQLSEAPRVFVRDTARLTPEQARNVENIRLLQREIDNGRAGVDALHTNPVTGAAWGPNKLAEVMNEARNLRAADPVAAQMMDRANNIGRSFWDYARDQGLITPLQHTQMTTRLSLLPSVATEAKPNWLERIARVTDPADRSQELLRMANLLRQEGSAAGTNFIATPQTMEAMMTTLMNTAAHNRARIFALDNIANSRGAYAGVVTRTLKAVPEENITVLRNGVEQYFRVTDPVLRRALTVIPQATDVITGAATRLNQYYQAAATGTGNPLFAIPAALYNGAMASIIRPAGTKVGLFGGDIVGGMAESMIGAGRGVAAMSARALSQTLEDSLRTNGFLSRILSPPMMQHLTTKLAATWQNSTVHAMQELGAVGVGRLTADTHIPNQFSMMQAMNPDYVSRVPALRQAWSMYRDVLDMVKSGANIQFFARNRGALGDVTAARMARNLVGDPATRGSGKFAGAVGTMPFSNVALQEFTAVGRSIRENPLAFGARLSLAAALPAMALVEAGRRLPAGQSEDYFDYLYRRMTPEAAARFMVLPIPGMRPEDMPHIPLPNTFRAAWAVARDGYAMLTGVTPEATSQRMYANALQGGVMTAQPFTTPPVINALLATTGSRFDPTGRGNTMATAVPPLGSIVPLRGSGAAVGDPGETVALPPDASPTMRVLHDTMLNSIVTSLAATAGQTGLETARAIAMATSPQGTNQPLHDAVQAAAIPSERTLSLFGNNSVWGISQRVSASNEDGRLLTQARSHLQRINDEFQNNVTNQGWAGSRTGGQPDANLAQVTGVRDYNMRVLMGNAVAFNRTLANTEMRALSTLRDQQAGINGTPSLNPRERAEQRNNIDRQIMERQREVLRQIQNFEAEQSAHYGRRIRLQDINRRTAVSDLPLLQPQ